MPLTQRFKPSSVDHPAKCMELLIRLAWDPDARVWTAESDNVPGLVMESGSFDALIERVRLAVPELLALNGSASSPLRLSFIADCHEQAATPPIPNT